MIVPAVCDNCGAIFPSGFEATNSTNITFSGCASGPCPACGGIGHIPDGVYNFVGNTIELLSGPSRTVTELQRLADILKNAREKQSSRQEISKEIEKELPELSSLKDILPKTRTELYAFIAIIISTIALLVSQSQSEEPQKIQVNNVINNIYQQLPQTPETKKHILKPENSKKVGRNEPCPCGSGKKYKKCCLNKK